MLNENLKMYRTRIGLSQEKVAELLGVSRQAVTKWEIGQSTPSSDNLIALSELYHVSLDELFGKRGAEDAGGDRAPNQNWILNTNLTRIAIICQAMFLNSAIQNREFSHSLLWVAITVVPLAICSIWMACNHRFVTDAEQRKKNIRIELLYCILQTAVALLVICLGYVLYINPKFMGRQLVRK